MKVVDKEIWEGFELEKELEHFATVEAQYAWNWRLPIDDLPEHRRYLKKSKGLKGRWTQLRMLEKATTAMFSLTD